MWGTCKIVNFSWLFFSTLVIGQNLLTQKTTLSKWKVNAFTFVFCVNGLYVGLCVLYVKMRTLLCGESTVAAKQKKLLSTLPGSLLKITLVQLVLHCAFLLPIILRVISSRILKYGGFLP